jgi:ATP-dependent Lhr-like helicase
LLSLAEKGLVGADSFLPVRQWLNRDKIKKANPRHRVNARVMALNTGRWDIIRPLKAKKAEDWLWDLFDCNVILCRETYSRPDAQFGWGQALQILRVWEFTGKIRRGYFIAGMSGAQFVRSDEFDGIMAALNRNATVFADGLSLPEYTGNQQEVIVWLNAADPGQVWGKALAGKDFMNIPGTLVALYAGVPVMVLERQGKTLRIVEAGLSSRYDVLDDGKLPMSFSPAEYQFYKDVIIELISLFKQKRVFPEKKRLTIKEYPPEMVPILKEAGFRKEMMDYVWWS